MELITIVMYAYCRGSEADWASRIARMDSFGGWCDTLEISIRGTSGMDWFSKEYDGICLPA